MARRLHTPELFIGDVPLDAAQSRHARDVLRLEQGAEVELFDDRGAVARGGLIFRGTREVLVRIERIDEANDSPTAIVRVASAVPKGERADWMIEKLSELGTAEFIPLDAERSVVKPEGRNKHERWVRIATESAKQSKRPGVMRIAELTTVSDLLREIGNSQAFFLSTASDAPPLLSMLTKPPHLRELLLLIGPEGGWTDAELRLFAEAKVMGAKLTRTILRVETAAIAAAAICLSTDLDAGSML